MTPTTVVAATEAAWYGVMAGETQPPLAAALRFGGLADRLAWVFCAGYQSALAATFPEFAGPGWACLASTTARDAEPCRLTRSAAGLRLDGDKTWIAGVDHVQRLIVAVTDGEGMLHLQVARDTAGVTLSNPGPASFLIELSQGRARFDAVVIDEYQMLRDDGRGRRFRSAEPLFVSTALASLLHAHDRTDAARAQSALVLAETLVPHLDDRAHMKAGLGELAALLRAAIDHFERIDMPHASPALQQSWRDDARLLKMFVPEV